MSFREKATTVFMVAAALSAMAAGCGGEPEFAPQPGPPDGGVDAAPPPPPVVQPTQTVAAPPPQTGACSSADTLSMTTMFKGRAAVEAPGMQPEGSAICEVVAEGQSISSPMFMLQPGFCYTFLAQALPTVTEVDVQVEVDMAAAGPGLAAFNLKPLLTVDSDTGAQAAASAKGSCYQLLLPVPVPVKLIAKARTGSGPVSAQAYKKKK